MAEGTEGPGIIIFTLWYLFIAFNYLKGSVFESREQRYQCKCRRAPCDAASNSCDIPQIDIDIKNRDDPLVVPIIDNDEKLKPTEDIKEEVEPAEDIKEEVEPAEDIKEEIEEPADAKESLPIVNEE